MFFSAQKNKCCSLDFHQDHNIYYRAIKKKLLIKLNNFFSILFILFIKRHLYIYILHYKYASVNTTTFLSKKGAVK